MNDNSGAYNGDGSTKNITLGFKPTKVTIFVYKNDSLQGAISADSDKDAEIRCTVSSGVTSVAITSVTFNDKGFTVATTYSVSGYNYIWFASK